MLSEHSSFEHSDNFNELVAGTGFVNPSSNSKVCFVFAFCFFFFPPVQFGEGLLWNSERLLQ